MWVVYGFGEDAFIESNIAKYSIGGYNASDNKIYANVCFDDFIRSRLYFKCKGSLYYLIKTNYFFLLDLVNYLNSLNSGFTISIVKYDPSGHLLCFNRVIEDYLPKIDYKDFKFGENFISVPDKKEFNSLELHQVLLKINSTEDNYSPITRTYLEYLLLVVLRILDPFDRPAYLKYFSENKSIIENIVYASNASEDWHSIYYAGHGSLTVNDLVKCLNIDNINKFSDLLLQRYNDYKQDDLITTILNGVK